MAKQEPSTKDRAERAARAAVEARRLAARQAATRRAEQTARQQGVPSRRPPAVRVPTGTGTTVKTTPSPRVQPTVVSPASQSESSQPAATAQPSSPSARTTAPINPAAKPAQSRPAHPRPAARPPAVRVKRVEAREEQVEETPKTNLAEHKPDPTALPDEVEQSPSDQREGLYSGHPTSIEPLPDPPAARHRTGTDGDGQDVDHHAVDGLRLPDPPRTGGLPPTSAGATVDIDLSHLEGQEPGVRPLPSPPRTAAAPQPAGHDGPDQDAGPAETAQEQPDADSGSQAEQNASSTRPDATVDLNSLDPGPADPGPADPGPADPGPADPGPADPGFADSGPVVPASADSGPVDSDPADPGTADSDPADSGTGDPAGVEQRTVDLGSFIPAAPKITSPVTDDSRPWIRQYAPGVPESYRYPLVPLTRFLDDAAQDFPDTPALSFLGTQVSFREMSTQVDRLAAAFTDLGLSGSDRLAVALPWTPQLVLTLHACWRLGVDVVVLDSEESPEVIAEDIRQTQPSAIIILDTLYGGLAEFRSQLSSVQHVIATGLLDALPVIKSKMQAIRLKVPTVSLPQSDGVLPFRAVLESASPVATQAAFDVENTTAVTTVVAGAQYRASHHNVLAGAFQARLWIPDMKAGREVVMVAGSPTDSFGLAAGVGLAMLAAATLVLPDPRSGGVARSIDTERPTILATTMDQVRTMLAPASKRRDLSSIRVTLARGVHFDPVVKDAAESRTAGRFRMAYAGAAVSGIAHAESIYADGMSNGAGLPLTDTVVECVDATGAPVDHGTIGNLVASGPQVSGTRSPLGLVGSVDVAGYVTVIGATESVVHHRGGASDIGVIRTALRRSPKVVEAEVRPTTSGADAGLHAHVLVSDDTVTVDMLLAVLRDNAPAQSPPTEWTTEVVSGSADPAGEPPTPDDEQADSP